MKKLKKLFAIVMVMAVAFSLCVMPASAYSLLDIGGLVTYNGMYNYYTSSSTGTTFTVFDTHISLINGNFRACTLR